MEIKALTQNDVDGVFSLECECFKNQWSKQSIEEELNNELAYFFTACEDNKVIGYIGTHIILDECYITNIAVTAQSRKKGVGTGLLQCAEQNAKKKGASFITLEVRVSNEAAISLYKANGYEIEGMRKNFYDDPKEDGLIMTKRFIKGEEN